MEVEYLSCYRFNRKANELPIREHVMFEYLAECEKFLESEPGKLVEVDQWPPYSFRGDLFSIDLWPAFFDCPLRKWGAKNASLLYSICKIGGLSVILPNTLLIVDPLQQGEVPELWRVHRNVHPCRDSDALFKLVKENQLDIPVESRDYGFGMFGGPLPGSYPNRARTIYLEVLKGETPLKHQKMVYKHKHSDPLVPRPKSGMVGTGFWELITPLGARFFAYGYGGIGWADLLRDFAISTNRHWGEIVNFEVFTYGAEMVRIDECQVGRVAPT